MKVLVVCMSQSPFNRSIWVGLARGFEQQGCSVQVADATQVPLPASLPEKPDLLFAVHGGNLAVETVDAYREAGVTTGVYLLDEPYEVDSSTRWARHYDWVFSVDRATLDVHAQYSHSVHMPCGYDEMVFSSSGPSIASDILMLGSCFAAREELLAEVVRQFGDRITWVGPGWRNLYKAGTFHDRFVTPEECAMFYRGAKISLNIHRDSSWSHFGDLNSQHIEATHLNPRFWEAAACGSFPFSSYRADIDRLRKGMMSFRTADELLTGVSELISNPKLLKKQSKLAVESVRKHDYASKAASVLRAIRGD